MKRAEVKRSLPLSELLPVPAPVPVLLATLGVPWACRLVVLRLLSELVVGRKFVADTNEVLVSLTLVVLVSTDSVALIELASPVGAVTVS